MARRRVAHRDREMAPCRTRPVSSASSSGAVVGEGGVGIEGGAGVAGTSSATFSGMAAVVSGMSCTKAVVLLGRRARTASGVGLNTPSEPRNRETCKLPYIFKSAACPGLFSETSGARVSFSDGAWIEVPHAAVRAKIPSIAMSAGTRREVGFRHAVSCALRERIAGSNSSPVAVSYAAKSGPNEEVRNRAIGMCSTRMPFLVRTSVRSSEISL